MAAGVEFELKQSDIIKAYNLCKKANVPIFAKWVRTFYEAAFDAGMEYALKDAAVIEYDKAYRNLQDICYVHDYCYDLIKDNVELKGNEYSVKRSREYAIKHLKESIENMTDLLKDLEGSEKE